MSLLQIAEPGESPTKSACKGRVVGIDLGTTNSLVAVVDDGEPRCLAVDARGGRLLPSVVSYVGGGTPKIGEPARALASQHPHDTIASVKRLMGRSPDEIAAQQSQGRFLSYRLAEPDPASPGVIRLLVAEGRRAVTPIEVSAEILRWLRMCAEEQLASSFGGPDESEESALEGVVITVPAYFDDAQRQATKDAGRLAGLNVLRLLNEPTAAALAYGLDRKKEGKFAVYDLGGGTFDVSILDLHDGIFTVMATAGDTALGGDDMDQALADLLIEKSPSAAALRAELQQHAGLSRSLLATARTVKHGLTEQESVAANLPGAESDPGRRVSITRAEFEAAIAPIVARTASPCRRALKDAELTPKDLDGVVLVGGATRVPAVRRFVGELFGQPPLCDLDPDQVVALGAAVQADILQNARTDALLIDVTPLSLGLELMGGVVEKIIPRNSRVPTGARQVFTTYADGQTGFDLHVVQGERETAAECRSLARFKLTGIPRMAAGMARLEVSFLIDENGLLAVTARELTSGREAHTTVKPSYGLTDEQVEQMLLDSFEHGESDLRQRMLITQRVEADRILGALTVALARDGALLSDAERQRIDAARAAVEQAKAGNDHRRIAEAITALDLASKDFAQRRMDDSLSHAVSGRAVRDIEAAVEHAHGPEAAHAAVPSSPQAILPSESR
ncbi:MAG TPA: Fe-S protein assembly chaperone HscA [Pseudomonadota bacterium]|nr:Fe-S protein assembly chaperone HscA [Pseudomonadota bacterium]